MANFSVIPARGMIFRVRNAADDGWDVIGGVQSNLVIGDGEIADIDDTDFSHGGWRAFLPGIIEEGNISFTLKHDFGDAGQIRLLSLFTSQTSDKSNVAFEIEFPSVEYKKEFNGVVLEFPFDGSGGVDGLLLGQVVIGIDGGVTNTDIS